MAGILSGAFGVLRQTVSAACRRRSLDLARGALAALLLLVCLARVDAGQVTVQVSNNNDDGYERNGTFFLTISPNGLRVTADAAYANQRIPGVRFPLTLVPRGATITSATFEGYAADAANDDLYATVYGEAIDNAPDFATVQDVDGRARTTASTTVAQSNLGTGWKSFDVTAIVQEIVSRPGWVAGQALALLFIPSSSLTASCFFNEVSDGNPTLTAKLTVNFSTTSMVLLEHSSRQVYDQFDDTALESDTELFRFQLRNETGSPATVTQVVFQLSSVAGIVDGDLTDLRIRDGISNVATGGVPSVGSGTITFNGTWSVPADSAVNYSLYADVNNLATGDTLTLALGRTNLTVTEGPVDGTGPSSATHTFGALAPLIAYSDQAGSGARPLKYSLYSAGSWSAPGSTAYAGPFSTTGWPLHWKVARTSPDRNRQFVLFQEQYDNGQDQLYAGIFDGSNWDNGAGAPLGDYTSFGGVQESFKHDFQNFDLAFEDASGEAVAVYGTSATHGATTRVFSGASWSTSVGSPNFGAIGGYTLCGSWVRLSPYPGSDRVALGMIANDCTQFGYDYAAVDVAIWNGSQWQDLQTVESPSGLAFQYTATVDVKFVLGGSKSGEALAVWANGQNVKARAWRPVGGWTSTIAAADLGAGNTARWLRLAAQPRGAGMVLAIADTNQRITAARYVPSARTFTAFTTTPLETAAYGDTDSHRPFDIIWDPAGGAGNVLLVYSDAGGIRYRISTDSGSTWGAEQTITTTYQAYWVQLDRMPDNTVHLAVQDQNDDLRAWTWDGSAWTFRTAVAPSANLERDATHNIDPIGLALTQPSATPPFGVGNYYRSIGTAGSYTDGSVYVTNGSAVVFGTGTQWRANNRGRGDRFTVDLQHYVVESVVSETQLILSTPYAGVTGTGKAYTLARQFRTLQEWEDCISFATLCPYFPVGSASLVTDDRSEVGIAYKDSAFNHSNGGPGGAALPVGSPLLDIDGSTTDSAHTITLTADEPNRHHGLQGAGVVLNNEADTSTSGNVLLRDEHVTVEWLEIKGGIGGSAHGIGIGAPAVNNQFVVRYNLIHDVGGDGVIASGSGNVNLMLANNIIHHTGGNGVYLDPGGSWVGFVYILNNTVSAAGGGTRSCYKGAGGVGSNQSHVMLANNIGYTLDAGAANKFDFPDNTPANGWADIHPQSRRNLSSDASANSHNISDPGVPVNGGTVNFVNNNVGVGDYHINSMNSCAGCVIDLGADLSALIPALDIDGQRRPAGGGWDIGADEYNATTAVTLMSFEALPSGGAVDLLWRTGSEIDNLGFHIYRSSSASGPWARLTSSLIPGQGFSAMGAAYAWRDSGLANGTRYYYRLEDVDTKSVSSFHGPVSAVPQAGVTPPSPPSEGGGASSGGTGGSGSGGSSASCPSWALAQLGSSSSSYTCSTHGDPSASSFRILSRSASSALVELQTPGFLTARDASGRVRALVPGFDSLSDPTAPALPLRRSLLDGIVGRQARIRSIEARENRFFPGLVAAAVGYPQAVVSTDGTVRPGRRDAELALSRGFFPRQQARLAGEGFQGEDKTLALELMPLRYDASRGALVLSQRLTVRVDFAGAEPSEIGRGRLGRRIPRSRPDSSAYAFLATSRKGLHAVSFETLFPGRTRPLDLSLLRLTTTVIPSGSDRTGPEGSAGTPRGERASVPFHVIPEGPSFGPGSRLFFLANTVASSTSFSSEVVYALERGPGGARMGLLPASVDGSAPVLSQGFSAFETNRYFIADVLDVQDLWQWEPMMGGVSKTKPFSLDGLDASSPLPLRLRVFLQGASDSSSSPADHHVQLFVQSQAAAAETLVAETSFDGAVPQSLEVDLSPSLLQEGLNDLRVLNVGDTGVSSKVFLDRFEVLYPQTSSARSGVFEGRFASTGTAEVTGLTSPAALVDATAGAWLTGYEAGASLRFHAEADHRYLAVSEEALLVPRVFFPEPSARLRSAANQADYLLIAPQAFMAAAQPLLERRASQGLSTFAASLEEITSSFGSGQPSGEALRDFLSFAYHHWTRPSPRYVLLFGDSNYDPRHFSSFSQPSPLPYLLQRNSYIWTASDPALAALNGDDPLPDLAIGRLPATTVEQAQTMVAKILDWEDQGLTFDGKVALVADNPDLAGDFEADVRDIEGSFLQGRDTTQILLGELGSRDVARSHIFDAFNQGLALISYVGHGGGAVWASENMLNSADPKSLLAQTRQPLMLTMNCLNGYFIAPTYESLAEGFLKAEGKGTIASFSPSGLSLDGPAHLYHRAVMEEITGGTHERLGDALLAAQKAYAQTGAMPELLSLYHLFGDPALRISP